MARRGSRSLSVGIEDMIRELEVMDRRAQAAVQVLMERSGDQAVAYMRVNAPWTDRTGNARAGLDKIVFRQGGRYVLNLFGRASYQIWLEVKNGGRYAIIGPTIQIWGPRVMAQTSGLLNRLGRR